MISAAKQFLLSQSAATIAGDTRARWNLATLVASRFVVVYFLLQWLPLILTLQVRALTLGRLNGPGWWGELNVTVGQWAISHVLSLPEHSEQFSANYLALFAGMVCLGLISAAVAVVWSLAARRLGHPWLFWRVHTCMRVMVGGLMLLYGWHKILPAQFDLTFDYIALPVGQHSQRDLLWAFMGASRGYQVFAGVVEVAGGLLLLTPRTTILGALISVAAMANVLALDIAYDAPVKFVAGQLFLMTVVVLAPYARALADIVMREQQLDGSPRSPAWRIAAALLGAWIVYGNFHAATRQVGTNEQNRQTPLYGIWDVEDVSRGGVPVPLLATDTTLWRRLVVQSTFAAVVIPMAYPADPAPNIGRYQVEVEASARKIRLTPFRFSGTTRPVEFVYERPGTDRLVLSGPDENGASVVMRLRRIDVSDFPLMSLRPTWWW